MSADSLVEAAFNPQTLNPYSYVRNNPVNRADPGGNLSFSAFGGYVDSYGFTGLSFGDNGLSGGVFAFFASMPILGIGWHTGVEQSTSAFAFGREATARSGSAATMNWLESFWDAANLALDVHSFRDNWRKGSYGWAALDAAGGIADLAALLLPVVPGGAGAGIKTLHYGDEAAEIAGKARRFERGEFSIFDWSGYPAGFPKPEGPFRILEGDEYKAAREAADRANRALHRSDPVDLKGFDIHEIHPVKLGGDPVAASNKAALTKSEHDYLSAFWAAIRRSIE